MSEPSIDKADEFEGATDEERREAEALARALEGAAADEAPPDAASMAAFVRTVASGPSTELRIAAVESRVFGPKGAITNVRRLPRRVVAYATVVLASAAAVLVVVRRTEPSMAPAARIAEAPAMQAPAAGAAAAGAEAAAESRPTEPTAASPTVLRLLDAERALLEAPDSARDAAFAAFRSAMATARDERLSAMIARHGGTP